MSIVELVELGCPTGARSQSPTFRAGTGLAQDTGGGYVEVTRAGALARTFTRILEELHSQYLLAFVPTAGAGRVHQVEVVANDK